MANNEWLPPPPGQPHVPPAPAVDPPANQPPPPPGYFPPTTQNPTAQLPTTQQFPPTQAFPGGPPGGFPPHGSTSFEQPAEPPKKKKSGLLIAGGLVAVAVIVAGILVLTGGDDDKTVATETTPLSTVFETVPQITIPPENTVRITLPMVTEPEVTEPAITDPPTTDAVVVTTIVSGGKITDDLGVFTIVLPDGLFVDTTPITTKDNFVLPSVAGAVDLQGFYGDDVTPGMTSIVVREDVKSTPAEVVAFIEPAADTCTGREESASYPTAIGASILLKLDGCGPDGTAAKVILVAAIPGSTSIVAIYVQGLGTSANLLPQAQTVFETVRLL